MTGLPSARSPALRRHGIDCPRDVSVTGFNDMALADRLSPALTTVRVHHYRAGVEAAELIVDMLAKGAAAEPRHLVLPVELIVRDSARSIGRRRSKAAATALEPGKEGPTGMNIGFVGLGAMGALIVPRLMEAGPYGDRLEPLARQGRAADRGRHEIRRDAARRGRAVGDGVLHRHRCGGGAKPWRWDRTASSRASGRAASTST